LAILAGCAPQKREPIMVLPESKSAAETLSILKSRSQNVGPLRAHGRCLWRYRSNGKPRKEDFAVKLWVNPVRSYRQEGTDIGSFTFNRVNPPAEVYMQGDVGFNPRGIVLGSNESEFWLLIKPKVSSYSWGRWSEQGSSMSLTNISRTLVEALGIVEVVDEESWSLSNEGAFEVLTRRNDKDQIIKKIYVGNYDYLIRMVEYFDADGKAVAVAELDKYKEVSGEFFVPTRISIIIRGEDGADDAASISLNLKSVKPTSFNEKQRKFFFNRPTKTKGYKHIYRIIDGRMIELSD